MGKTPRPEDLGRTQIVSALIGPFKSLIILFDNWLILMCFFDWSVQIFDWFIRSILCSNWSAQIPVHSICLSNRYILEWCTQAEGRFGGNPKFFFPRFLRFNVFSDWFIQTGSSELPIGLFKVLSGLIGPFKSQLIQYALRFD